MSLVQYGDDTIQMGRIVDYRTTSVKTQDDVDYICTENVVVFQGLVSFDLASGSLVDQAEALCRRLRQPRQTFRLFVGTNENDGDKVILESPAPDFRAGPFCDSASIVNFSGYRTAVITATFRVYTHLCEEPPAVLANRWGMTHTLDDAYYTQRVVSGQMVINPRRVICADDVRENCFRQIPKGMQFVRATFRQSSDGLTLDYNIVIDEKYQLPPNPATRVDAVYREETNTGGVVFATMIVSCEGPKSASKKDLLMVANKIISARFDWVRVDADKDRDGKSYFLGGSIEESLHDNRVTCMVRAQKTGSRQTADSPIQFDNEIFGQAYPEDIAIDSKGEEVPVYGIVSDGASGIRAAFAAWKDACTEAGQPIQESPTTVVQGTDGDVPAFQFVYDPISRGEAPEDNISEAQRQAPYEWYEVTVAYKNATGLMAMPLSQGVPVEGDEPRETTVEMVRVHAPTTYKIINWTARRHGQKPEIPKPKLVPGETLLRYNWGAATPEVSANSTTPIYSISGMMVIQSHGAVDHTVEENLFIGTTPITKFKITEEGSLGPGNFTDKILYPED